MNKNEEYFFAYKGRDIIIKIGKKNNIEGVAVFYAKTNFNNIFALAECQEKALENCIKKIKFYISLLEKNINLISQDKAIMLAKKYFQENFRNKELIKCHLSKLSYNIYVENEILTFSITVSNFQELLDNNSMNIIAVVYVNLITTECDMVENTNNLKKLEEL